MRATKKKRKSRRDNKHKGEQIDNRKDAQCLYNDVVDLLTMVAMKLPQDRPFPVLLRDCLHKSFNHGAPNSRLPKYVFQSIFENFEVRNPDTMEIEEVVLFMQKPTPKRKKKQQPLQDKLHDGPKGGDTNRSAQLEDIPTNSKKQPQNETSAATTSNSQHSSLLLQPRMLLAPSSKRKNSLFASGNANGHRSRFVGSHFNTNLTNASSLFREVKAVQKRPLISKQASSSNANHRRSNSQKKTSSARPLTTNENTKVGQTNVKRKHLHCFQSTTTNNPNKSQKIVQASNKDDTTRSNLTKGLGLDGNAARRVMAAARTALKRQS